MEDFERIDENELNNSDFNSFIIENEYRMAKDKYFIRFCTLLAFTLVFAFGFILFGVLYTNSNGKMLTYGNSLEASYERAVYDLADNVNNIEINLSKAQVSNTDAMQYKYLRLVCDNCKYAQSNFQLLPIKLSATREGVAFINKMDGYCTSLITSGKPLTDFEKQKIKELYNITLELKTALNNLMDKILQGYNILMASEKDLGELDDFSSNFESISADSVSYPSMIFDGPFSDSLYNKEIKGLTENEVDKDTALNNLDSILKVSYSYEKIDYLGETNGDFTTFDFEIKTNDGVVINASVAKRAGFLLTMSGYITPSENASVTMQDCIQNAISFASISGASDMKAVWTDASRGIAFINLAPVVNNIIYYPDLVKVKVDMNTGLVIGYDAQSYAYNHTDRTKTSPTLSPAEARNLLDLRLEINTQKVCIIPLEYGGEELCYEFNCDYDNGEYYIYINAFNGQEERVMKVVSTTEEGALTK